jgi:hypothetical protein
MASSGQLANTRGQYGELLIAVIIGGFMDPRSVVELDRRAYNGAWAHTAQRYRPPARLAIPPIAAAVQLRDGHDLEGRPGGSRAVGQRRHAHALTYCDTRRQM